MRLPGDLAAVAWQVCERVVALLRKRGPWLDAAPDDDAFAAREPPLASLFGASIADAPTMWCPPTLGLPNPGRGCSTILQ